MAEIKTRPTGASVEEFLNALPDEEIRADCWTIIEMMRAATKAEPRMWGPAIIGFGSYTMTYADGRQLDWMQIGFSPRKQNISLYVLCGSDQDETLLTKLGKHSCGKSCLYIKRLSDIHLPTLKKLVQATVKQTRKSHPAKKPAP